MWRRLRWKAHLDSITSRFGQRGDDSVWCAGVRILRHETPKGGFMLGLILVAPNDQSMPLSLPLPGTNWGAWLLNPVVPSRAPVLTKTILLNSDSSLLQMEVWAVRG